MSSFAKTLHISSDRFRLNWVDFFDNAPLLTSSTMLHCNPHLVNSLTTTSNSKGRRYNEEDSVNTGRNPNPSRYLNPTGSLFGTIGPCVLATIDPTVITSRDRCSVP